MRVLVVEDDLDLRGALVECLADAGFLVSEASDGRGALDLLESSHPDVVLLDLLMEGMDGWGFRRAQRSLRGGANIPVVAMTGLTRPPNAEQLDVAAWLAKPFTFDQLVSTIFSVTRPEDLHAW